MVQPNRTDGGKLVCRYGLHPRYAYRYAGSRAANSQAQKLYSTGAQQPPLRTATFHGHQHARQGVFFERGQQRADSYGSEGHSRCVPDEGGRTGELSDSAVCNSR